MVGNRSRVPKFKSLRSTVNCMEAAASSRWAVSRCFKSKAANSVSSPACDSASLSASEGGSSSALLATAKLCSSSSEALGSSISLGMEEEAINASAAWLASCVATNLCAAKVPPATCVASWRIDQADFANNPPKNNTRAWFVPQGAA